MPLSPITSDPRKRLYLLVPALRASTVVEYASLAKAHESNESPEKAVRLLKRTDVSPRHDDS